MTKAVLRNGEYVLDTPTGIGMFEITYLANHVPTGKTVVIKTFGQTLRQHTEFDQFKQQFKALALRLKRCKHPHLEQVLDYFEEDSLPYLVIENIKGQTLARIIKTQVLPEAKALEWIRQVSAGLSVLHKAELLHQDIKPENILLRQDTKNLVLHYNTSKFIAALIPSAGNFNFAGYAASEQFSGETPPTQATDIYALAATFYCLLAGHPPLPASVREILHSSRIEGKASNQEEYQQLFQKIQQRDRLSPKVKWAIWRGLELVAQKRPQTVEAWLSLFNTPEQSPNLNGQVQHTIKPNTSNTQKLQPSLLNKNPNPQTSLEKNLVTTFKIPPQTKSAQSLKPETTSTKNHTKSPLRSLLITGAIAAATGIGFGFALRLNSPQGAGSTLMHTEQSFPPTSNWPMSQPPAKVPL